MPRSRPTQKLKKASARRSAISPRMIGDPHVRHMGTIGGSIANNDPAADYPAALLALGATIVTNKREIAGRQVLHRPVRDGAEGGRDRHRGDASPRPAKAGYEKFRNPASRYAMTGVFVAKGKDGVRVAVTGAGDDGVFRSKEIEAALAKKFEPSALDGVKVPADELDERHPRLAGIPRQSGRGDGQARGGAGQRVAANYSACLHAAAPGRRPSRPGSLSASAGTAVQVGDGAGLGCATSRPLGLAVRSAHKER